MKKIIRRLSSALLLILVLLLVLIGILWARGNNVVSPKVWQPAPAVALENNYAPNTALDDLSLHEIIDSRGPEDIAYDGKQYFYTGAEDGMIFRFTATGEMSEFANTGGRPLGMQFDARGHLIVADADKGLISIDPQGAVSVLTNEVDGVQMRFVDDLDIAADGTIWFSDASQRFGYDQTMHDFVEASFTGRLLSYTPSTQTTKVHIDSLFFANGVALGPNDDYVLVNETGTSQIHRLWLKGQKAGEQDLFVNALPGHPDNLSFNGVDTFWVALASKRDPKMDELAGKTFVRTVIGGLPLSMIKPKDDKAFVIGLGLDGEVKYNLQTQGDHYGSVTSVNQYGDMLYLGNLNKAAYATLPLSQIQ